MNRNPKKEQKRFRFLPKRNSRSEDNERKNESSKFVGWNDGDYGSGSFEFSIGRTSRAETKKTSMKIQNEKAIKNYKVKNRKEQKFYGNEIGIHGVTSKIKPPANLQGIFTPEEFDENEITSSTQDHSPPYFEKNSSDAIMIRKAVETNLFFDQMTSTEIGVFIDAFGKGTCSLFYTLVFISSAFFFYLLASLVVNILVRGY